MIALIEENMEAIVELCERFEVRRLALFGSAATGTFDPATSDLYVRAGSTYARCTVTGSCMKAL